MAVINLVGFLDAETGSQAGCGSDWPLCNGQVVPRLNNLHVDIEFAHRVLVAGFALVALGFVVWAWRRYGGYRRVRWYGGVGVGFTLVQSVLGAVAVIWINPPLVLALHLGFGLLAMAGVVLLADWIWRGPAKERLGSVAGRARSWALFTWLYLYLVIYWGSFVAFKGDGTACQGWPLCSGRWLPVPTSAPMVVDWVHRVLAVGLLAVMIGLALAFRSVKHEYPHAYRDAVWALVATVCQIFTGANLVRSHVATGPYVLHIVCLMWLFALTCQVGASVLTGGRLLPHIGAVSYDGAPVSPHN